MSVDSVERLVIEAGHVPAQVEGLDEPLLIDVAGLPAVLMVAPDEGSGQREEEQLAWCALRMIVRRLGLDRVKDLLRLPPAAIAALAGLWAFWQACPL